MDGTGAPDWLGPNNSLATLDLSPNESPGMQPGASGSLTSRSRANTAVMVAAPVAGGREAPPSYVAREVR